MNGNLLRPVVSRCYSFVFAEVLLVQKTRATCSSQLYARYGRFPALGTDA